MIWTVFIWSIWKSVFGLSHPNQWAQPRETQLSKMRQWNKLLWRKDSWLIFQSFREHWELFGYPSLRAFSKAIHEFSKALFIFWRWILWWENKANWYAWDSSHFNTSPLACVVSNTHYLWNGCKAMATSLFTYDKKTAMMNISLAFKVGMHIERLH